MIINVGTVEHAAKISENRHPGVQTAMAWLAFSHLPEPLTNIAEPLYAAAWELLHRVPNDSAELTSALNKLVEAKDWMVRAGIRSDFGRPGPVGRPAEVVDPPAPAQDYARGETYSDKTMDKVRAGLSDAISGLTDSSATGIISALQNRGILFRERI